MPTKVYPRGKGFARSAGMLLTIASEAQFEPPLGGSQTVCVCAYIAVCVYLCLSAYMFVYVCVCV